jgi:hypothetical protein
MIRSNAFFSIATMLGLLLAREVRADQFAVIQSVAPPAPLADDVPEIVKALPQVPAQPRSLYLPAAPVYVETSPIPDQYFVEDPLLDTPDMPRPGWFVYKEFELAAPHIYRFLYNTVTVGSRAPDNVNLPNRGLNWTLAPKLEIGYWLPSGFGGFSMSYRNISSSGGMDSSFLGPDGAANLRSELAVHVIDADYISKEFTQLDQFKMRWRGGLRTTIAYYNTVLTQAASEASAGTGILQQEATNSFRGVGPHLGVELRWDFARYPGMSLLGSTDYGATLGRIKQGFFELAQDPLSPSGLSFGTNTISSSQTVQMFNARMGLNYQPPEHPNFSAFLGFQYDLWWGVGRLSAQPSSRGDLSISGFVLRLTYNY